MTDMKLSLSWDAYQKNICNGLGLLQQKGEFVDMTIAADGHHVKVHQMIMSLVSPYIKELITSAQSPHPIIFLNRVTYPTLQSILEYAYTGEVLIAKDNLCEFLEASKALHIRGLEHENVSTTDGALLHFVGARDIQGAMDHIQTTETVQAMQTESNRQSLEDKLEYNDTPSDDDGNIIEESHLEYDDDVMDESRDLETIVQESQQDCSEAKEINPTSGSIIQYSLSCQGSIQIVLNRFLYRMRHTRKTGERLWRCQDYHKKACPAYVLSRGDTVLQRGCAHNHPFHDKQILKRVRNGNMYTAFNAVESIATFCKKKTIKKK